MFWYDGCVLTTNNVFSDLLQCQWLCEEPIPYKSKTCLEPFDEQYRGDCNGPWTKRYYFDKYNKRCEAFWYSGCKGTSQNMYRDERTCLEICGHPSRNREQEPYSKSVTESTLARDRQPRRTEAPTKLIEVTEKIRRKIFNICEYENPCKNNGKCNFDLNKNKSFCECAKGYKGENCTEQIVFDPCVPNPCQNGATCLINAENKTAFQCFCTKGYGGDVCNKRPCDLNPCFNNGSCTPTTGYPWFVCKCDPNYSGRLCEDEKNANGTETTKYGSQVKQISSGEQKWIEEIKKREEEKMKMELEKAMKTTAVYNAENENSKSRRDGKPTLYSVTKQPGRKSSRKIWKSRNATAIASNPLAADSAAAPPAAVPQITKFCATLITADLLSDSTPLVLKIPSSSFEAIQEPISYSSLKAA
ncbi:unnamed protein product [Enterobius vermicularis]|uniref:Delta-like protein n=1 Tax=Enterobius vermicularis TaxID=51028 RepID=A0A0N4VE92_ENTVE|nr:unnamed protein product [Enterobius vermicularis]